MSNSKRILLTGATDGIGKLTAEALAAMGHNLLLHGRNAEKLEAVRSELSLKHANTSIEIYCADLSSLSQTNKLASAIRDSHQKLDVLVNNAGVFKIAEARTQDDLDVRFVVNAIAPYLLTRRLLPLLSSDSRVINLSSAAQAPFSLADLARVHETDDSSVYAKSKLAITMWTRLLGESLGASSPTMVAVNPASFLGSKMVKEAYGIEGNDIQKGVDILVNASLSEQFVNANGKYYDNDRGTFAEPHVFATDERTCEHLIPELDKLSGLN